MYLPICMQLYEMHFVCRPDTKLNNKMQNIECTKCVRNSTIILVWAKGKI